MPDLPTISHKARMLIAASYRVQGCQEQPVIPDILFTTKKQIDGLLSGLGCNSYNRFDTFLQIAPRLQGELYWYALRDAYDGSDNLFFYSDAVKAAFNADEPGRDALMNKQERKYLQNLPGQITIYRGMTEQEYKSGDFGVSWTLKKETAEFFAFTYLRNHATNHLKKIIHELVIDKSEAIAFFNERQEFEIIHIYQDNGKP